MSVFDFNNDRAKNLSDPIYDKDAVNFRSARFLFRDFTGNTHVITGDYLQLSGGTGGPYTFTGNTITSVIYSTTANASAFNGLNFSSGGTNLNQIFVNQVPSIQL